MYGRSLTPFYRREVEARQAAPVQVLVGARQTGKTSLARSIAETLAPERAIVLDLTRADDRLAYERDPGLLGRRLRAAGPRHVFIDEFQRVPALLDEIQSLVDTTPDRFRFFLTGSSSRTILRRGANLLPGRSVWKALFPVTPEESGTTSFLDALATELGVRGSATMESPFPTRPLTARLVLGELPGLWDREPERARDILASYATTYLEEEIRLEALVKSLAPFAQFLELAAVSAGQPLNYTSISNETGRSVDTIKSYYEILRETHIAVRVPAFSGSARKLVLSTPKVLFFDLGVRNAVARLPLSLDVPSPIAGPLFEQWVGITLYRWLSYHAPRCRLSTWRTRGGAEVDYVIEAGDRAIPIEVKYGRRVSAADLRGLRRFMAEHPRLARRGFVVFTGAEPEELLAGVQAVPALTEAAGAR